MEPWVFLPAAAVVILFVAFAAVYTDTAQALFDSLQSSIVETFGWFYILAATVLHYLDPPHAEGSSPEALREAMRYTYYHWGLHPWAIYTTLALPYPDNR